MRRNVAVCMIAAAALTAGARAEGADVPFVRGDTNADGAVNVVDAENIVSYLFHSQSAPTPTCKSACDANDDEMLNIADVFLLLRAIQRNRPLDPPADSPDIDPTPSYLDCASFTPSLPIAAPEVTIGIDACAVQGGDQSYGLTSLWVSTATPIAAIQCTVAVAGIPGAKVVVGKPEEKWPDFAGVSEDGATVLVVADFLGNRLIGPGTYAEVAVLAICVPAGTEPGTYDVVLTDPISGDLEDLHAHIPAVSVGTITVLARPTSSICPTEELLGVRTSYALAAPEVVAADQREFEVAVLVKSADPVLSLVAAVDYGERRIDLVDVVPTLQVGSNSPLSFDVFTSNGPAQTLADDAGEGYAVLDVKLAASAAGLPWDPAAVYEVARLRFRIREGVSRESYARVTLDRVGPQREFTNAVRIERSGTIREISVGKRDITVPLSSWTPPIPPSADDVRVTYRLSDAAARPGDTDVPIYFDMITNSAMQGFAVAFAYNKGVLEATAFECFAGIGGPPDFLDAGVWNPADPDSVHGCYAAVLFDFHAIEWYMPPVAEPIARALFTILPDAPPNSQTDLVFDDEHIQNPPVPNVIVVHGSSVVPGFQDGDIAVTTFANGRVRILEEVAIFFLRGDANGDFYVNIADPILVLSYLFRRDRPPTCLDAADANDNGTIDIADPICVLYQLFGGTSSIAGPYPHLGADTTPDNLGPCVR